MSLLKNINLEFAEKAFATANTPLFLLRKLRTDPVVADIATHFQSSVIFEELRQSLKNGAGSFTGQVLPFVLLVALSLKLENKYLLKSSRLNAKHHAWFPYCCEYLMQEFQATSIVTLNPKRKLTRTVKKESRLNTLVISGT
jgi:hypothetical protein